MTSSLWNVVQTEFTKESKKGGIIKSFLGERCRSCGTAIRQDKASKCAITLHEVPK